MRNLYADDLQDIVFYCKNTANRGGFSNNDCDNKRVQCSEMEDK